MKNTLPALEGGSPVRPGLLPLIRPSYGYEELKQVLDVFHRGVFCSVYAHATKARQLEAAFADYVGARYAVAFSSGTTAQHTSLLAAGVGPGDEVIVPPLTFASTAYTVLMTGAKPVFADVEDESITLDPLRVAQAITPRTRAIVPVHWFGNAAAMDELLELAARYGLTIIEDCAHAYGTRYRGRRAGTLGQMACWSLQESKTLTAAGEGGVLTTDDENLARIAASVCDHGKDKPPEPAPTHGYQIVRLGNNYRLSEIHAAFALAQLAKAGSMLEARRAHTEHLDAGLTPIPGLCRPEARPESEQSHAYYAVRFDQNRFRVDLGRISTALTAENIGNARIGEEELSHVHPLFVERCGRVQMPVAELISRELLILPLYPDLSRSDLDDVIAAVRKVASAYGPGA